jgi:hypothetical protein
LTPGDVTPGIRQGKGLEKVWRGPAGSYGPSGDTWHVKAPDGSLGNLRNHDVEEHEDGTITVSPSILITTHRGGQDVELWHGYLERGVWREV